MKETHKARSDRPTRRSDRPPPGGTCPLPTPRRRAVRAVRKPQGYRHESGKPSIPMTGLSAFFSMVCLVLLWHGMHRD